MQDAAQAETAQRLDFSDMDDTQGGAGKITVKRKPQIVKSDALFLHLAQIIEANFKDEEGSQQFGPILGNKGENFNCKGPAANLIITVITASNHPLFHGKTTTNHRYYIAKLPLYKL